MQASEIQFCYRSRPIFDGGSATDLPALISTCHLCRSKHRVGKANSNR
uniref:Uncharacterized protein n=1 Tax=Arundo donax TaxID=35708 RepID=A0A0A9EDV0_ARUDO